MPDVLDRNWSPPGDQDSGICDVPGSGFVPEAVRNPFGGFRY
jgi:hypothetical protein